MPTKLSNLIYSEASIGRILTYAALVAIPVFVALVTVATKFQGLSSPQVLDHAQLARHVAAGDGYVTSVLRPMSLAVQPTYADHPDLLNAPVQPTLLALVYAIGGASDTATATLGVLLWLAMLWLTYLVARVWFSHITAMLALLFCLSGVASLTMAVNGLPSPLMAITVLAAVWAVVPRARDDSGSVRELPAWRVVLAGAICGLAVLTNYLLVVLVGVLGAYLAISRQRKGRVLVLFLAGFVGCLAPWVVRNLWVSGAPVPRLWWMCLLTATRSYPGETIWRLMSVPQHPLLFLLVHPVEVARKVVLNLAQYRSTLLQVVDPVVVLFVVAGLLGETRGARTRGLLAVVLGGLVVTVLAGCLVAADATLVAAWLPLLAIVAAANLRNWLQQRVTRWYFGGIARPPSHAGLPAWGRVNIPVNVVRGLIVLVVIGWCSFQLLLFLMLTRPPGDPRYAQRFGPLTNEVPADAVILTDQPALVAWFADRCAVGLPQAEIDLVDLEQTCGPVDACFISTMVSRIPAAEQGPWWVWVSAARGVYRGLVPAAEARLAGIWRVRSAPEPPEGATNDLAVLPADVAEDPQTVEDRLRLANTWAKEERFREASELLREVVSLDPQNVQAVFALWQVQAAVTQPEHFQSIARQVMLTRPQDRTFAPVLREAARVFARALVFQPEDPWLLLNAAITHAKLRDWEQTAAYCQRAARLGPRPLAPRLLMGQLYLSQGLGERALIEFEKLTEEQPDNAAAYEAVGQARWRLGQLPRALDAFAKAQRLRPDWTGLSLSAGAVCTQLKNYGEALEHYNRAIQLSPRSTTAWLGKAQALQLHGDRVKAITTYQTLLEMHPDQVVALNNLALLYAEQPDQLDRGTALAEHARRLAPRHPSVQDTLGWLYHRAGRHDEAIPLLQAAVARLPALAIAHYHLGKALLAGGRRTEAAVSLRRALLGQLPPETRADAELALSLTGSQPLR
ncbi:tetratricopeptide repeat protein [bacterium]|nr:tetratricopeptide repeat protein [bacterium]